MGRGLALLVGVASGLALGGCGHDGAAPADDDAGRPADAGAEGAVDASSVAEGGAATCDHLPEATVVAHGAAPLAIAGDPGSPLGIYDPSLSDGALAYSSTAKNDVHTRIAITKDHGASFAYVAQPNAADAITVTNPDGRVCGKTTCPGSMWHEVPSLVHDPTDPDPTRAYKLFVHTYVSLDDGANLQRAWGWIGEQTAPAPAGPWSGETKLLGWNSDSSISTDGIVENLSALSALADCLAFTEPGAVVSPFGLDLALTCLSSDGARLGMRVVLLRSIDHGQTFRYVSALFDDAEGRCDASPLGMMSGANPFFVGGAEYVAATPIGSSAPVGSDYTGCLVVPFANGETGALAHGADGSLVVARFLVPDDARFAGPCTYGDDTGYLVGLFASNESPQFRVVTKGVAAP